MRSFVYVALILLTFSCGGATSDENDETVEINTEHIDAYVNGKLDDSQEYEVALSLRYSKGNETYEVVQYIQNDTVILFLETEVGEDSSITRNTFFENGKPVYVEEYIAINRVEEEPFIQRRAYLDGANKVIGSKRKSFSESELETLDYVDSEILRDEFDFDRPKRAINQTGEFELKFEEFIIIDPQTYLVLGNDESGYDVALFVAEKHALLEEINANKEAYKGKVLHVYHQFVLTNGIERMLFIDAEVLEKN